MGKTLWRDCKVWPSQTQHHSRHTPYVSAFSRFNSSVVWDFRKYWSVTSTYCIYAGWYNISSTSVDCTLYRSCRMTERINTSTRVHSFLPLCLQWERLVQGFSNHRDACACQRCRKTVSLARNAFIHPNSSIFIFIFRQLYAKHILYLADPENKNWDAHGCRPFIYGRQPYASQF